MADERSLARMPNLSFSAVTDLDPVALRDVARDIGVVVDIVTAKDLIGKNIEIINCRAVPSDLEDSSWYIFAVFQFPGDGAVYGVALGGGAVIETLMKYAMSGHTAPLSCTLVFHEGKGAYGGYYTLE